VEELVSVFSKLGFSRSKVNQAIYFKWTPDEHIIITVSVDNMAVTANHISHIKCFKVQLQEHFEILDLGELNWLLGLKVTRDRTAHTITLSQKAYVNMIVEHFHLSKAKSVQTPMEPGLSLSVEQGPATATELQAMWDIPYQQAIGSLMYAATSTCPNIVYAVTMLLQFM
jgi:hypothetical protein